MKVIFKVNKKYRNSSLLKIHITMDNTSKLHTKAVRLYISELKNKLNATKIQSSYSKQEKAYKLKVYFDNNPTQKSWTKRRLLNYLSDLGVMNITGISQLNQLETDALNAIYHNLSVSMKNRERLEEFDSSKTIISGRKLNRLKHSLYFIRSDMESLFFIQAAYRKEYENHLEEIDFLIQHLDEFVLNLGFIHFINVSVLKKIDFYKRYINNVKVSQGIF